MTKNNTTRDDIIRIGTELVYRRGFKATGLDAILREAGVPKGSFYHYFKNKEEFGLALIDAFGTRFLAYIDEHFAAKDLSPLERIRRHLAAFTQRMTDCGCEKGCLLGNIGQEMAALNEQFRIRLDGIFIQWRDRLAVCVADAQTQGEIAPSVDPAVVAEFIVSGWEGAILRAKVTKSVQPMQTFMTVLFNQVLAR